MSLRSSIKSTPPYIRHALCKMNTCPDKHCVRTPRYPYPSLVSIITIGHTTPCQVPCRHATLFPRLGNLLIRIRTRSSLWRPLRLSAPLARTMVVLAIVMIMRVLRLSPALVAFARTRSAVIRLTIRVVVARTIARGLVAGLAGFAGCMVYAAH
jgi:hypothetical protein